MINGLVQDNGESNEELLNRCRQNDESALRELLSRHERPVYGLLYRMLGSHEDSEEALTDVFVKVWKKAGSFRGASKFTTWLYRIASNTARDFRRSRKARLEVTVEDAIISDACIVGDAADDPQMVLINTDEAARIEKALWRLSEDDRRLVTLYHFQELSLEEISEIVGINRTNLKVKLFRARQKLRVYLEDMDRETENEMQTGTTKSVGLQPESAESA